MKTDWPDDKIKQLFTESRQRNEQQAPTFARTWRAATTRAGSAHSKPVLWRLAIVGAAMIIVAGSATLFLQHSNTPPMRSASNPTSIVSITEWSSPTDFLLETTAYADNLTTTLEQNQ